MNDSSAETLQPLWGEKRGAQFWCSCQHFLDTEGCSEGKIQLKGRHCQPVRITKQGSSLTHLHR